MGKRVVLLAGLLVLALGSTAVAQESSPPPWFGSERAEVGEQGLGVTVPDGWVAFDVTGDVDEQVRRAAIVPDVDAFEASIQSIAEALHFGQQQGMQLAVMEAARQSSCPFMVVPLEWSDLDLAAARLHADLSTHETIAHIERPVVVELPAGPTRLITWGYSTGLEGAFYMGRDANAFMAQCVGEEPPEDDWLSIVGTLEFLPPEE